MIHFATSKVITSSGASYPITLKIRSNRKAIIREVTIVECYKNLTRLKPWQILDLLAEIMPKYVHAHSEHLDVSIGNAPVTHEHMSCSGHPCLIVKHKENGGLKYYRLDCYADIQWAVTVNVSHLRAMVYWWRCNRDQYAYPTWEWGTWRNHES